jgi:hypothetical protein
VAFRFSRDGAIKKVYIWKQRYITCVASPGVHAHAAQGRSWCAALWPRRRTSRACPAPRATTTASRIVPKAARGAAMGLTTCIRDITRAVGRLNAGP